MRYDENIAFRIFFKTVHIIVSWPKSGRNAVRDTFLVLLVVFFVSSGLLVQILYIFTHDVDLRFFIDVAPQLFITIGTLLLIPVIISKGKQFEEIVSLMENDWKEQRTEEENEIKEKWFFRGKKLVMYSLIYAFLSVAAVMMSGFITPLQDLLIPLNDSRTKRLPLFIEAFVDQQKYFYWLMLYVAIAANTVVFVVVAVETVIAIAGSHVCGMFSVVGYKLEKVMCNAKNVVQDGETNLEKAINNMMKICVKEHCKSLRFAQLLRSFAEDGAFLSKIGVIIVTSISLVDLTSVDRLSPRPIAITTGALFHFYTVNYMGQSLIDSSSKIFWKSYNSNWYNYPITARKLLLVLMTKSCKYFSVTAKGFGEISIVSFSMVLRVIMSYCLALRKLE